MRKKLQHLFYFSVLLSSLLLHSCFQKQDNTVTGAGEPMFSFSGRVIDIDNNRPLTGAMVRITSLGLIDTAEVDGHFKFIDLKVGNYPVIVTIKGYTTLEIIADLTDYYNRDVIFDIEMIKQAIVVDEKDLPFENPSGIWYENSHLYITSYDNIGGTIYMLTTELTVKKIANYLVTWMNDSCLHHIETTHVLWPPDSVLVEYIFMPCIQRFSGLVRIGDYFYATNGGRFWKGGEAPISKGIHSLFRIDPQTLNLQDIISIQGFASIEVITDLAWDGRSLWLCERNNSAFPKLWQNNFVAQSQLASPVPNPEGLTWDGRYLWVSAGRSLFQLNPDLTIRNRYKEPDHRLGPITWDGNYMWVVHSKTSSILKLELPFTDHL